MAPASPAERSATTIMCFTKRAGTLSRFLTNLSHHAALVAAATDTDRVMVDIDDTIIEVHGYTKQGSGYGYSGVRGLNALLATVSSAESAPVIVAQRLRKGSCG